MKLHGNLTGLARSEVKRLEALTRRRVPPEKLLTQELAREITGLSRELGRKVGVMLDRSGHVVAATVGTDQEVEVPDLGRQRVGAARLQGLRLLHSYLGGEPMTAGEVPSGSHCASVRDWDPVTQLYQIVSIFVQYTRRCQAYNNTNLWINVFHLALFL